MLIEKRIEELGYTLPEPGTGNMPFVGAKLIMDKLVFTSGNTPRANGQTVYTGKCGADVSMEDAQKAAALCAINCLGAIKRLIGDLDRIQEIVKVTGFVNCELGFTAQPQVMNGASEVLKAIFGDEAGSHARSAVGMAGLPGNAACEVEMIVLLK